MRYLAAFVLLILLIPSCNYFGEAVASLTDLNCPHLLSKQGISAPGATWWACNIHGQSKLQGILNVPGCTTVVCREDGQAVLDFARAWVGDQPGLTCIDSHIATRTDSVQVGPDSWPVCIESPGTVKPDAGPCKKPGETCTPNPPMVDNRQADCCDGLVCSDLDHETYSICCAAIGAPCTASSDCCGATFNEHDECIGGFCANTCVPGLLIGGFPCTQDEDCESCLCDLGEGGTGLCQEGDHGMCGQETDTCDDSHPCCPGLECSLNICDTGPGN